MVSKTELQPVLSEECAHNDAVISHTLRSTEKFAREMHILTAAAKVAGEAASARVSSESSSVMLMPAARLKQGVMVVATLDKNTDVIQFI